MDQIQNKKLRGSKVVPVPINSNAKLSAGWPFSFFSFNGTPSQEEQKKLSASIQYLNQP